MVRSEIGIRFPPAVTIHAIGAPHDEHVVERASGGTTNAVRFTTATRPGGARARAARGPRSP